MGRGFIRPHLCPALGSGGAGSAQGHHGAAEDESGLLWHRLGHRQEVHLCCLFPPGSQAQGEPVGAVASFWPDLCLGKCFSSHSAILQIWASPQACVEVLLKGQVSCPNEQRLPDVAICCLSS